MVEGRLLTQAGKLGEKCMGAHSMVRRVDRNGEASIWCRTCSGYARQILGPKLMNRCKPKKMDRKEYGKIINEF